jgi:hypothetical protein
MSTPTTPTTRLRAAAAASQVAATTAKQRSREAKERLVLAARHAQLTPERAFALGAATPAEPLPHGLPPASVAARRRVLTLLIQQLQAEHDAL